MRRLRVDGLPLPEVYICENPMDVKIARDAGIPYIKTKMSDIDIVKVILYRVLREKFPKIKWSKILGRSVCTRLNVIVPGGEVPEDERRDLAEPADSKAIEIEETEDTEDIVDEEDAEEEPNGSERHEVSHIASDVRKFTNGGVEGCDRIMRVDDYCFDEASHVNIETLQNLGMLPKFMDDAADAIRINMENRMRWRECWNKRLGAAVGDASYATDAANLIILDISGSIPEGISATMLQLIDTLRNQAEAELIVTGSTSMYWGKDDELPDPQWIRSHIGYDNECIGFLNILERHVAGRHFGNVISFGDNDSPYYRFGSQYNPNAYALPGVTVDRVMHYHTVHEDTETGYARWVSFFCPDAEQVFDTSWCEVML